MSAARCRNGGIAMSNTLQPIEQVLTEVAAFDGFAKVAVGRGDHANVCFQRSSGAETLEFALLKNTQKLRLCPHAHLGDFVEE